MNKKFLLAVGLLISTQIFAQSPKKLLIEHFTNTKCVNCATRNPGFYSTLANYPQVLHIAFHPSAPYASCYFNQQNVVENDDRTYFYGQYGSTPKFVLNGKLLPSANPAITTTTIDTALNQTSPIEVSATEELFGVDSVRARVVVRTTGNVGVSKLLLFAGVAQDTIQYSAGNGEQLHRDVFRKALTKAKGDTIQVPALNDSLVLVFTYKIQSGWREANLSTIAFVQLTDTKQVLNAAKSYRVVSIPSFSPSPRQVVIEHFTNTRCGICASRNPGFYSTLSNYPQVIHIAFHPSAPYSQCYFSLQNTSENDDRTYFYNTYGSTPDFFLNGKFIPNANPAITNTTIDTALNQTSSLEVIAYQELLGTDSVNVRIVVKTTGTISLNEVLLFAGVAEEPVNYNAQNGETVHHDVFRKALTKATGDTIQLAALNDSSVFLFTYKIQNDWNGNQLRSLAFVQQADTKEILNADNSNYIVSIPSGVNDLAEDGFSIFPNPANDKIQITGYKFNSALNYSIFDLSGRKIVEQRISKLEIDVSQLSRGIYFLKLDNAVKKFVKE